MRRSLAVCLLVCSTLAAQQTPAPTELSGKPFYVTKTWTIGGEGNWDALTVDARAGQLFIAHGPIVQVVDVETGSLLGKIGGLIEAHSIVLDSSGEFGFLSDGPLGLVEIFDRRRLEIIAKIATRSNPRQLVYDPDDKLLFAISVDPPLPEPRRTIDYRDASGTLRTRVVPVFPGRDVEQKPTSHIAVIDTEAKAMIGGMLFSGKLGAAQYDGQGHLFVGVMDRHYVLRIDAQDVARRLQGHGRDESSILDWSDIASSENARIAWAASNHPDIFFLESSCNELKALALDNPHQRLFTACENGRILILNSANGDQVAKLNITASADALAYDPDHALLYAANGNGMLSILRQHVTDSYAVIQELPIQQRARTLAVNPVTGEVYLVTNLIGVSLHGPTGIGALQTAPIPGSFEVLVVGN